MSAVLGTGWAVLLIAGWAAHPLTGGVRLFPHGTGTWNGAVVAATWARHAGLMAAAAGWVLALAGWGNPALRWTRRQAGALRAHAALAVGFGLLGFAVLGCGLAGLAYPSVLSVVMLVPLIREVPTLFPVRWVPLAPDPWLILCAVPVLIALPGMLAPETSWDAMAYHLRLPATYLIEHRHFALIDSPFAGYPGLTELHYLLGIALTGSSDLAKLQHAACWLLTAGVLFTAADPVGRASRSYGAASWGIALSWLMLPLGMQLAGMAYVDLATAWLAALAAALAFQSSVPLAAVCAGLAFATKYTGGVALLGLAAVVPPARWRVAAAWAVVPAGIWLVRNGLALGNPVFPFAASWLGGLPSATVEFWQGPHVPGGSRDWTRGWTALVADDGGVGTVLSPIWLAALIPAVVLGRTRGRWRFAAAGAVAWLLAPLDCRFLLPVIPAALLAAGAAWEHRAVRAAGVAALVLGAPLALATAAHGSFTAFDTLPPALGLRSREDHLRNGLDPRPEYWEHAGEIARRTPPRARLLYLAGFNNYYVPRRCSTAHQHIDPVPLQRELRRAGSAERLAIRLRQQGYTYLVDLARATTAAVESPGSAPDAGEAKRLVSWLRNDTTFAFRSGEAHVYALGHLDHPRRLGRVPLVEPMVLSLVTRGEAGADQAVRELAGVAPESSSAALARGLQALLASPPRLGRARTALLAAVRDPEASSIAWRALGWAQDRTGEPGRALGSYRQAAALNPSDGDARFGAGMVLANAGRWREAAVELEAAVRLDPGRAEFRAALASLPAGSR